MIAEALLIITVTVGGNQGGAGVATRDFPTVEACEATAENIRNVHKQSRARFKIDLQCVGVEETK